MSESTRCVKCGGNGQMLGTLGNLTWYRCRACGWEWPLVIRLDMQPSDVQLPEKLTDRGEMAIQMANDEQDAHDDATVAHILNAARVRSFESFLADSRDRKHGQALYVVECDTLELAQAVRDIIENFLEAL